MSYFFPSHDDLDGPAEPAERRGTPRILFVDDELALVQLANRALPYEGCRVFGLGDPRTALAELRANPGDYDVLVTDLRMPGLDGVELARQARRINPELPIILMSGDLTARDRRRADLDRIDDVVPKPYTMAQLAERVYRVMARRYGSVAMGAHRGPLRAS